MPPAPSAAPAPSPHGVRLAEIVGGPSRGWRRGDLLALKALFHVQRRLELLQRRPDAPLRAPFGAMRGAAASIARLLGGAGQAAPWFDTIAADVALTPAASMGTEARLREWLDACPPPQKGEGVAMVIPTLAAGGAEGQMARLAMALAADGVAVTVLVKHSGEKRFDFHRGALGQAGVQVREIGAYLDETAPSDLPPLDPDLHRTTRALIAALKAIGPAAVHGWMDEMGAAGGLAAAAAGVPRIVIDGRNLGPLWFETRGVASIRAAFRALEGRAGFANNSEAGAADYRAWLDRPDLDIAIVRNGFDITGLREDAEGAADLRARLTPQNGRLIGGMMRFAAEKRPLLWIEAAAAYARLRPDARFVLWGDGPLRQAMTRRAEALGLATKLTMPGVTSARGAALGAIDALMLASVVEGTPNVALEAQSLGTPVVAIAAGGVREAVAPALSDLIVDKADAQTLADALMRAESWTRARTRASARDWVLETFSPETQQRAYLALYGLRTT